MVEGMITFTQSTRKFGSSFLFIHFVFTSWWCALNMIVSGWRHRIVQAGRPVPQDPWDAGTISMIVVSLANDTWIFRFVRWSVWIFVRWCTVAPFRCWVLLLLLLPFLLLLNYLVFSVTSFTKRRGRSRGRNKQSRRWGSNFIWLLIRLSRNCSVLNDRGREKPYWQANCESWKGQCAMCGELTSPQEEKGLGFPPRGNPWLVDSISST